MIQNRILWMYEAAIKAGVPTATLYKEINAGCLRSIKVTGNRHYILGEDLKRWMNGFSPRNKAAVDSFQQLCEMLNDPKFLKHFKNVPQFADVIKNLITNPQSNSERSVANE